jgi:hypothetical protein
LQVSKQLLGPEGDPKNSANIPILFRRTLPNGTSRRLDRLSNRLTKIVTEARTLATP